MLGGEGAIEQEVFDKLRQLELAYNEKKHKQELVRKEVLKIEDDMRQLTNIIAVSASELEALQSRLQDKKLEFEGGVKELASTTLHNQEQLVELSVLKMRVHQMETLLGQQKDKVFNLQRHQVNLELAMGERLIEIKTRNELLRQRRKHLEEELAQLKADIGERAHKIQAIQARYENVIAILGRNEDGSFVTATQIKIETAQEKQILLRKGNDLNDRVIKAEKDIEAIENTLVLLNYSNNTYKKSLEPVREDSKNSMTIKCTGTNLPIISLDKELCELNETTYKYAEIQKQIKIGKADMAEKKLNLQVLQARVSEEEQQFDYLKKIRLITQMNLIK